jgi:hypothetical protein
MRPLAGVTSGITARSSRRPGPKGHPAVRAVGQRTRSRLSGGEHVTEQRSVSADAHQLRSETIRGVASPGAETAGEQLRDLDTTLLRAIVPPQRTLLTPPLDLNGANTIEHQPQLLADWPPSLPRAGLEIVWQGLPMPAAARQLIADGPSGTRRVALALGTYWNAAIAPHWEQMRAVLDADIGPRAKPQRRHHQRAPVHTQTMRHGHLMAFRPPRPLPAHPPLPPASSQPSFSPDHDPRASGRVTK